MLAIRNKLQHLLLVATLMLAMALTNVAPAAATATGNLYALGNTTGSGSGVMELYLLDKTNASSTFVASTGTVGLRGLAIDPTTGKFYSAYGAFALTAKRGIVEIDPITGAVTDIGGTKAIVSLAFDSSGQLYGAENAGSGTGRVYKISTSNGTETFLGTVTSQGNEFGPGIAYDSSGSALYFKGWPGQLSTLNTTSGVETLVGTVSFPWYASHSFDFDENGNVYYAQHPCSGCGDGLAFASAGNIFSPTNLGFMGIRVWGLAYQINANQPPTASAGGPYQGDEGSAIAMNGATASDTEDTLNYSWTVSDSLLCSFDDATALNPDLTCTDNGNFTATLEVNDGVNPPVTSDADVTVDNVAPTASLGNNGPINEGSSANISFSGAFDPSSDDTTAGFHYAFDCNGGSLAAATYAGSGTSDSTSCAFADNGSFTVSGKIMDKDGGSNEYTTVVTVDNVAPTIAISGASNVNEGSPYSVAFGALTDPGTDTVTAFIVNWGDGNSDSLQTHTYTDGPNNYNITVDLTDEDGTFLDRANSLSVTVDNVAPTITGITANASQTLTGTQVTFTGSATDPSSDDTTAGFSWQWSVDAGPYTAFAAPGVNTFSTSFLTCGTHTVTAQARDKDLGVSAPFTSGSVSAYEAHFLQPLDEGMQNLVQKGRVIPVKISIGCNGVPLTGLAPAIQLLSGDQTAGTETGADEIETLSSSAADTTGIMRPADSMYIYNLQVPSTASTGALFTIRVRPFGTGADLRVILKIRK